jgi:hypothetical protein
VKWLLKRKQDTKYVSRKPGAFKNDFSEEQVFNMYLFVLLDCDVQ